MSEDELEAAIAAYRQELREEAGLAAADLDELEDHLRDLIAHLRAAGHDARLALAEATRRLGEPPAIAREYARTRPVFGARPSRARAWSAVALMCLPILTELVRSGMEGFAPVNLPFQVINLVLIAGLIARRSWARALLLGNAVLSVVLEIGLLLALRHHTALFLQGIAISAAIVAFLAPWRRGELTSAGWALALTSAGYVGVAEAQTYWVPAAAYPALGVFVVGLVGLLLRARWASLALATAAVLTVLVLRDEWPSATSNGAVAFQFWLQALAVPGLLAAALLSWRGARGAGTLRALAS